MANEPQIKIEKELAAYAKKRREDAGATPPLHPATRRLLQGEAVRVWRAASRSQTRGDRLKAGHQAGGWRRWAIGFGVFVLLGLAASFFLPDRRKTMGVSSLALNSYKEADVNGNRNKSESAPKVADDLSGRDRQLETQKDLSADKVKQPALGLDLNETAREPAGAASSDLKKNGIQTLDDESKSLRKLELSKSLNDGLSLNQPAPAATPSPAAGVGYQSGSLSGSSSETAGGTIIASGRLETPQSDAAVSAPRMMPAAPPMVAAAREGGAIGGVGGGGGGGFGLGANAATGTRNSASEQFARVDTVAGAGERRLADLSGSNRVLSNFRVEQTGDQLRVIDSDGSVYIGTKMVETDKVPVDQFASKAKTTPAQSAVSAEKEAADFKNVATLGVPPGAPASASAVAAPMAPGYSFQVRGTNVTLNQEIVFSGRFTPIPAPAVSSINGKLPSGTEMDRLRLSTSRVSGRVVIGGTNQVDITAEAAKP